MPRKTNARNRTNKSHVITFKVSTELNQRIRQAVKTSDSDISKLARIALREKLERLGA